MMNSKSILTLLTILALAISTSAMIGRVSSIGVLNQASRTAASWRSQSFSSSMSGKTFTISVGPTTSAFPAGSSVSSSITLTSINSFKDTVRLTGSTTPTVSNGPAVTISPASVTLEPNKSAFSTLTISSTSSTPSGLYAFTVTGTSGQLSQSTIFTAAITPISITISSSTTFTGVTVKTSGTLTVDSPSTALSLSGTASVVATNSTTGTTLFSKTYTISKLLLTSTSPGVFQTKFLLNVAVSPFALSSDTTVTLQPGSAPTTAVSVTRNVDINQDGIVNVIDLGIVQASNGCATGSSCYNARADLNADGIVNIIDMAIVNTYLGSPDFIG